MSLRHSLALELSLFWSPGPHFSIFVKPVSGCWLLHLRPAFLTQRSPALSSQCCRDEPPTYGWQQLMSLLTLSCVWYWLQQSVQESLLLPRGLAGFLACQSPTSCLSPPLFPDFPLLLLLRRILAQEFLSQSSGLGRSQLSKPVAL